MDPLLLEAFYAGHGHLGAKLEANPVLTIDRLILEKLRRAGQLDVEQDQPPISRERETTNGR